MNKQILLMLLASLVVGTHADAQRKTTVTPKNTSSVRNDTVAVSTKHRITFVELGSVNCIPCRAMQPVMKSVEAKYGGQVKVVFHDVWKEEQAHFAREYGIRVIPTQVFLDASGKELMRHEGFFPENQIDAFLQSKGLKAKASATE